MDDLSNLEYLYAGVDDLFAPMKKRATEEQERGVSRLVEDVKAVLEIPEGRRFVWWVLSRGGLFTSTYNGRALDQAFFDGQRVIAAETLSLALKADPLILSKLVEQKLFKQE